MLTLSGARPRPYAPRMVREPLAVYRPMGAQRRGQRLQSGRARARGVMRWRAGVGKIKYTMYTDVCRAAFLRGRADGPVPRIVQLEKQGFVTRTRFWQLISPWVFIEPSLALGA